jgi:hypothetical protein
VEETSRARRRKNKKTGIGIKKREIEREKDGFSTRFLVFPSTSRFSSHQCGYEEQDKMVS